MDWRKIITIEPGKRSGKPCIRGTRMAVKDVLEYLAGGMSVAELLDDFPQPQQRRLQRGAIAQGQQYLLHHLGQRACRPAQAPARHLPRRRHQHPVL